MYKKLMCLVLVLGLSSVASAWVSWDGGGDGVTFEDADNWDKLAGTVSILPAATDQINMFGLGENTATLSSAVAYNKFRAQYAGRCVDILSGGSMAVTGSYELGKFGGVTNATGKLIIRAGASANLASDGGAYTALKLGGGTAGASNAVDVYGSLTAGWLDQFYISKGYHGDSLTTIYNGGSATITSYTMVDLASQATYGTAKLAIEGSGVMYAGGGSKLGDRAQYTMLRQARADGLISGDGTAGNVSIAFNVGTGVTTVQVPEPATIALLGLGGLLLRKRR